jgi:hypothetical protein
VTVTVLTGARPGLLDDTLTHLPDGLVDTATVIVLVNGGDADTLAVCDRHRLAERGAKIATTDTLVGVGDAMGVLAGLVDTSSPWWLHLEDDWRFHTLDDTWLDAARLALRDPTVAQVRLRHHSEPVLATHMVTGQAIVWHPHPVGRVADAHLTLNPNLMRTVDAHRLWPSPGERAAQRVGHRSGLRRVVQLHPGAFHHTGGDESLRAVTGCAT